MDYHLAVQLGNFLLQYSTGVQNWCYSMHSKSTGLLNWLLRTVQVYRTSQYSTGIIYRTGYYRSLLDPGKEEEGRRSQSLKTGEESLVDIIEEAGVSYLILSSLILHLILSYLILSYILSYH